MKRMLFLSLFAVNVCLLSAAENNWTPDLKTGAAKGLKSIFSIKGKGASELKDGIITMKAEAGSPLLLIDYKIKLTPGTDNTLNFEVKGSGRYLFYVEFKDASNKLRGCLTGIRTAKTDWEKVSDKFAYPYDGKGIYVVIMASKGSGISVRNISITGKKQTRPEDVLTEGNAPDISLAIAKDAKTLPTGFDVQGKGKALCSGGVLKLSSDTADFQRIRKSVALVPGGCYRFAYEVKGTGRYGAYVEYRDEKGVIRTVNGVFKPAAGNWTQETAAFAVPAKAKDGAVVFAVSQGKVQFRNLALGGLTLASMAGKGKPAGLLTKGKNNLPEKFNQGGTGNVLYTGDSIALLAPAGKTCLLIRKNLPLEGGKKYTLKFQTCGLAGNYACYIEYRNDSGSLISINGRYLKAPAVWKSVKIDFTMPEGGKVPYIVIAGQNNSKVLFRNVTIEGMKE